MLLKRFGQYIGFLVVATGTQSPAARFTRFARPQSGRQALRLDPKQAVPLHWRGHTRARQQNYAGAVEDFSAVLALDADDDDKAAALRGRGAIAAIGSDVERARKDFEQSVILDGRLLAM